MATKSIFHARVLDFAASQIPKPPKYNVFGAVRASIAADAPIETLFIVSHSQL